MTTLGEFLFRSLILRAAGINCDQETALALRLAGAEADVVHVNALLAGRARLHPYQIFVIPGGFSYGDDISAGKVLGNQLRIRLADQLETFVAAKKLVIGICNGFQVLVKTGLLPGFDDMDDRQLSTLAVNESGKFQCEWVGLERQASRAKWLDVLPKTFELPIAHGEGRFVTGTEATLSKLIRNRQVVFRYKPRNPNGSSFDIAGITNHRGNVIGLMPHPERFVKPYQHPAWTRQNPAGLAMENKGWEERATGGTLVIENEPAGLQFWKAAVNYVSENVN
jgi:phosphoribosylformylglycinamidine synthase I